MEKQARKNENLRRTFLERLGSQVPPRFRGNTTDFMSKFYSVFQLRTLMESHPDLIDAGSIRAVAGLLKEEAYTGQRQGFFLFREAAATLASFMTEARDPLLSGLSYEAMIDALASAEGDRHRAIAGAMGELPFAEPGPDVDHGRVPGIPAVRWEDFLKNNDLQLCGRPVYVGRSLVAPLKNCRCLLVFKRAVQGGSAAELQKESLWMEHLSARGSQFPVRFDIPRPVKVGDGYVFSARGFPPPGPAGPPLHAAGYAVAFLVHREYFGYPNAAEAARRLSLEKFEEVLCRNAWLLGRLTAMGIVHTAVIPLFHNRTQRHRRQDRGVYEWVRAGRLDRWLFSCAYPNIGVTGVRDFEHLEAFKDLDRKLYRLIGDHFLGMMLVAGSYFRNRDAGLVGTDRDGRPVDARFLFEADAFKRLVEGIFYSYFEGFAGTAYDGFLPLNADRLVPRMIEEMGVDRHMQEILRVADQKEMSADAFQRFLTERGFETEEIAALEKGAADIEIESGPHLGGFNQTISLPELIESVGTMSALCIAGRFRKKEGLSTDPADVGIGYTGCQNGTHL